MLIHTKDSTGDIYFTKRETKKFDMERSKLSEFLKDEFYDYLKNNGYEVYFIKDSISKWYIYETNSIWYNKEFNDIKFVEIKKQKDGTITKHYGFNGDTDLSFFKRMILEDFYFDKDLKKLDKYPEGIGRFHLELYGSGVSKEYFEENKHKFGFIDYTIK